MNTGNTPREKWRIYYWWKLGIGITTFCIAGAYSFDDAERWVAENVPFESNKKRGVLFKKLGHKIRIFNHHDYERAYGRYTPPPEPEPEAPQAEPIQPLLFDASIENNPPEKIHSIWKNKPPVKHRL